MRSTFPLLALLVLVGCANDPPYQDCSSRTPCGGDTTLCLQGTAPSGREARFCTARCATISAAASSQCPANSACIRYNNSDPVCLLLCTADSQCPFTNGVCRTTTDSMGARVCVAGP